VKPDEFRSLMTMIDAVFRPGAPPTMGAEYPHLFTPDNFSNLRVVREDGKIVSHVGTTIRSAAILGCPVRVGNIGAVGTYKEYRGRGFAGACFDDACAHARAQGVDFMHISGDRSLYRRAGCRRIGLDEQFTVPKEIAAARRGEVTVERYADADLRAIRQLHADEPVRYLRPLEEWQRVVRNGRSTHAGAELGVVRRSDVIVAYAGLTPPRSDGTTGLQEFAGDRAALLGALDELMEKSAVPLKAITLHVQSHDCALRALLAGGGLAPKPAHAGGTLLILNFPQFMERLRPLMEERAGTVEAARLSFRDYNGRFVFAYEGETVVATDRGGAAQLIWGTHEPQEWQWAGDGQGKQVLQAIFPVPALVYGFSYV
jgi:hypothetical protein